MKRHLFWPFLVVVLAIPARADQAPAGKLVKDTWDAAYLQGGRTGFFHTTVREVERDGKKLYETTMEMSLTVRRYGSVVTLRMRTGGQETAEGKVVGLFLTQILDKGQQTVRGRVDGKKLLVSVPNKAEDLVVPWDDQVIGPHKQELLLRDPKLKPGDELEFLNYELSLLSAVKVRVQVKQEEEVDVQEVKKGDKPAVERTRRKLLRVEVQPGKVNMNPLPKLVSWLDGEREVQRAQMELPGLGQITLYRTLEAVAKQQPAPELLPDLGLNTLIKLNKPIDNIHDARSAVYKITIKDEDDPRTVFAQDTRQKVLSVQGDTIELQVKAFKNAEVEAQAGTAPEEFSRSSFFLDSDSPAIKQRAARIVGTETDPLKKGQLIEKWVHDHMTFDSGVGFVPSSQICRDLKGDCRQHGMLCAALCRAAALPARTALGLVYVNDQEHGPTLGFHMWTEVWIKGNWLPLDATLGQGGIGVGHLKICEHSWSDTQTLAPLLPVIRAMGKIKVEVVKVE
jgi:hypothetical protein